jgi:hypothetical protein
VALTQAGDAAADGIRAAIQLENTELFSMVIADPTDLAPKPITGLTGIAVTAGQRLYFRVNSRNDGAFDTVAFDPTHHLPHGRRRPRRSGHARRERPHRVRQHRLGRLRLLRPAAAGAGAGRGQGNADGHHCQAEKQLQQQLCNSRALPLLPQT